jgi:hypothetical protein
MLPCDISFCPRYREQIPRSARDDSQKTKTKIPKKQNPQIQIKDRPPSSARCNCGAAASGRACRVSCRIRSDRPPLSRRLALRFPWDNRTSASGGHSKVCLSRPFRHKRAALLSLVLPSVLQARRVRRRRWPRRLQGQTEAQERLETQERSERRRLEWPAMAGSQLRQLAALPEFLERIRLASRWLPGPKTGETHKMPG